MAQFTTIEEWSESIVGRAADYKSAVEYTPMWLNWQSSWFVISRLSVRVRSSAFIQFHIVYMGRFPSGQRGQTVNLLQIASVVRIHLHPFSFSGIFSKKRTYHIQHNIAGWSSLEARRAHNPKVIGSNPIPATQCPVSSVGRAKDWKSLCLWFDSETGHFYHYDSMGY